MPNRALEESRLSPYRQNNRYRTLQPPTGGDVDRRESRLILANLRQRVLSTEHRNPSAAVDIQSVEVARVHFAVRSSRCGGTTVMSFAMSVRRIAFEDFAERFIMLIFDKLAPVRDFGK